ncbi:MAG: endolytic transglycosylase MltG [Acidimicrobiia bacterium]
MATDRNPVARRRAADLARSRRRNLATLVVLLILLAPLAMGSIYVLSNVETSSAGSADIVLEVQANMTPAQVGDMLQKEGVIANSKEFQYVALTSQFQTFKVGRYDFVEGSTARAALDTLRGGPASAVPDIKLLLPPGLTLGQIVQRVGALEGKSGPRFLEVLASNTVRSKYQPPEVTSLEGLTWPDTYFIGATESENEIAAKIVKQFDAKADAVGLANAANGLTPYQEVIVASLIEAEAGSAEDMPLISAVIHNRLKQGMPLQIDATLCYAKGGCPPVPTDKDRKIDSPYNTYKIAGLPPTPIRTVSEAALKAALAPAAVDYLYYVSDKNGKTYYATTLAEHEKNVAKARSVG